MWVGTVRGLTRLYKDERTKYTTADGLGSDEVRAILEDRSGDLWVGTLGGGVSRLHNGRFTTLSTTNGLSSNNVWALHEDSDGVLWIGTDNGLCRFQGRTYHDVHQSPRSAGFPRQLHRVGTISVGCGSGTTAESTRSKGSNSRRWHGSSAPWSARCDMMNPTACSASRPTGKKAIRPPARRGMGAFGSPPLKESPSSIRPRSLVTKSPRWRQSRKFAPTAARCSETVRRRRLQRPKRGAETADLRISHLPPGGARVLEFHYTANTFVAPEKARFKYRLVGLDDHWIDAGTRRQAYFTDLRPGDYRFEVHRLQSPWCVAGAGRHAGVLCGAVLLPDLVVLHVCGLSFALAGGLVIGWRVRESRQNITSWSVSTR